MRTTIVPTVLGLALLCSCAVGPRYRPTEVHQLGAPAAWHASLPHAGSVDQLTRWWSRFGDSGMDQLIDAAETASPTIAVAVAHVRASRAQLRSDRAEFFPSLSGAASLTRASGQSAFATQLPAGLNSATSPTTTLQGALDVSWELDLFGGARRSVEGGRARLSSSIANWHDARVTLAAEVASSYAILREYQSLISLYEEELTSRQTTQRLTALKIEIGAAPRADALQTEGSSADSASNLENFRSLYAQQVNQLVQLTALPYDDVERILRDSNVGVPDLPVPTDMNVPAAIVTQRPDVRSAERLVQAASADIGVAVADEFPTLTLVGSIGVNSLRSGSSTTTHTWSYGPSFSLPIFSGGRASAKVESARASYDEAIANYHSRVLTAVEETEDALVRIDAVNRRRTYAETAQERYQAYFAALEDSYRLGRSTLLELETARLLRLASEEALLAVRLEQTQSWIALYKAAGGGWNNQPANVSAQQSN